MSSPQARWRRRRCSTQGEKLQRSGRGPSCRSSCSMSVGAATYTVRTFPKLANHTGPKRSVPLTWENGRGESWRRGQGTPSLARDKAKGIAGLWKGSFCSFANSQLVCGSSVANPSYSLPRFPSLESLSVMGKTEKLCLDIQYLSLVTWTELQQENP